MIVFAHTKFSLVRIKGSGVKRGRIPPPSQPEQVFEISAWIGLNNYVLPSDVQLALDELYTISQSIKRIFHAGSHNQVLLQCVNSRNQYGLQ